MNCDDLNVLLCEEFADYTIIQTYAEFAENPRSNYLTDCLASVLVSANPKYEYLCDESDLDSETNWLLDNSGITEAQIIEYFDKHIAKLKIVDGEYMWLDKNRNGEYEEVFADEYDPVDDMLEYMRTIDKLHMLEHYDILVFLPVSMYDHSGVTIWVGGVPSRTNSFTSWDCSYIGVAYVTKKRMKELQGEAFNESAWKEEACERIASEMKVYNAYITGEVYETIVFDEYGDDVEHLYSYGHEAKTEDLNEAKRIILSILKKQYAKLETL